MLVTAQSTEDRLTIPFDRARVSRRRCFGDKFRRDPAATDDDVAAEAPGGLIFEPDLSGDNESSALSLTDHAP
jgi:hypothetical protein